MGAQQRLRYPKNHTMWFQSWHIFYFMLRGNHATYNNLSHLRDHIFHIKKRSPIRRRKIRQHTKSDKFKMQSAHNTLYRIDDPDRARQDAVQISIIEQLRVQD
jgi:hypothetical protein